MKKKEKTQRKKGSIFNYLKKNWWLYMFVLPTLIWYIVFHYIPMGGVVIAFKRYNGVLSIWDSPWVGLKWFKSFFNSYYATTIIRNTLVVSFYSLMTFPLPIAFAMVLNEVKNKKAKQVIQTITYAPHFISMVVLVSMLNLFFSPANGFINHIIEALGGTAFDFMSSNAAFPHMYVWSGVWQNLGWDCIIYVAALAGV
ncbi:MAG: sugar ABC transporter permease, partial [Lachnospiraceae bacterium]|nr:sugar ABC transporter permease [Lachnospiraceae bacterium]